MSVTTTSAATAVVSHRPPRRALRKLIVTEFKAAWRDPAWLVLGLGVPVMLLVIFGLAPGFQKQIHGTHTTYMTAYVPLLVALALVIIGLISFPIPLVVQRERAFLRRLSTTPAPPRWLLLAQMVVNLAVAVAAVPVLVLGAVLFCHVAAPAQPGGLVLSALLATVAIFALGLLIAAVAPNQRTAAAIGTVLLYLLLFFAGLWTPRQTMSATMLHISNFTPLGAGVQGMQSSMQGTFPAAQPLLVLAAYAVVFGLAAVRLFRWE